MRVAASDAAALPGAEHRTSNGGVPGRPFDLEERLLDFSARIIRVADSLHSTRAGNHVGGQLLRSGTAPLPNHGEAESAESMADFVHKLKICLKEFRETRRWLRLIKRVPLVDKPEKIDALLGETEELTRIFVTSIRTASAKREASSARVREDASSDASMFDVRCSMFDVEPPAGPPPHEEAAR